MTEYLSELEGQFETVRLCDAGSIRKSTAAVSFMSDQGHEIDDVVEFKFREREWVVANAPRPIPGIETWRGKFRHGVFYAAGPIEKYAEDWLSLDASLVCLWTRAEVIAEMEKVAAQYGGTVASLLSPSEYGELANSKGLPWCKEWDK
jgi:hypothetical protein